VLTAQKVKPLINKETAKVAAAINLVWRVNSDHQRAIASRRLGRKLDTVRQD